MHVSLAAELSDGRRVGSDRQDFAFSGPRRRLAAIYHRYVEAEIAGENGSAWPRA